MKKRKKTIRNLHVEEIEYLDEDEQESLIDRYKIKEKKKSKLLDSNVSIGYIVVNVLCSIQCYCH